jgi:tight adherence protein B
VIPTLLCLAGALLVWPPSGPRSRLARRRVSRDRLPARLDDLAAPLPAGVLGLAVAGVLSTPVVAVLAGACMALSARAWRSARRATRDRVALQALVDGLAALAAELRAGRPVDEAVRSAAAACGVQDTSARLVRAVRDPPRRAGPVLEEPQTDEVGLALRRISAAVLLSSQTGCSLAEVVTAVEDDLRARLRASQELRSATAGPRASAALLAALPVLGLAMGAGVGADPWGVLTTTGVGQVLLVVGVGLEIAGVVWAGRLVRQAVR